MLPDDVQDLQLDRLIISDSLDSSDASAPSPTVHINDSHLDSYVYNNTAIDSESASPQENVTETPPKSSQEQESNTDDSTASTTSSIRWKLALGVEEAAVDNGVNIDSPAANKPTLESQIRLHDDTSAIAVKTPISSEVDNKPQLQVLSESAPIIATDFT
ncbi:MAG: hypothetical protein JOS17DRAFT_793689 [Linnemannia elongata]|nr:MAG: hypothetical protein JOS17DRAFT_793689 [Linnemannia elongata]